MYPRTRRKKRTDSMEVTTGERESDEEDDDEHSHSKMKHQTRDPSKSTRPTAIASLVSLASKNQHILFSLLHKQSTFSRRKPSKIDVKMTTLVL